MTWWQFLISSIGASLVTAVALVTQGALAARRERRREEQAIAVLRFEELRAVHLEMLNALVEFWRACDRPGRLLAADDDAPAILNPENRIQMPDSARLDAAYSSLLVYLPRDHVDVAGEAMRWAGRLAEVLVQASHPIGPYPPRRQVAESSRNASSHRMAYADLVHEQVMSNRP